MQEKGNPRIDGEEEEGSSRPTQEKCRRKEIPELTGKKKRVTTFF
jgi:hypothetical protein